MKACTECDFFNPGEQDKGTAQIGQACSSLENTKNLHPFKLRNDVTQCGPNAVWFAQKAIVT